ncbi:zinc finger A20 and AN1 domain-containing stress-associated protein 5 [Mercurialis annua]|uniref:zinc finger A20 and AN1 domain-containing stress-associated protein 5 n=1 Tax=Mercurialis annua TaxID=3986 RepID=UPI0021608930|nr:zinc finger A20 and AN1 domain-containing stress-associated protein 5 [Mercurialis annua]
MAQKTEKEETEFKVPETLTLCVNNCGVTGNPATNNMCQKCFNATTSTTAAVSAIPKLSDSGILNISPRSSISRTIIRDPEPETSQKAETTSDRDNNDLFLARREVNRCSGCRKRVGLTGFRCRCGELFCWEHRYSDRHDCSYDYKTVGREAIARENPVVKAAKIVRV